MGENFQVEWEVKVENDDGRFSLNLLGHHGGPTLPVHFHFTKDPGRELLKVNLSGVKKNLGMSSRGSSIPTPTYKR